MTLGVVLTVFALVAVAELPDKTMIATLVLGSRHRPLLVWIGASAAFLVHVCLAVAAGRLIELLPHTALEIVITAVFFVGAVVLLVVPELRAERKGESQVASRPEPKGPWRVVVTAFAVILVGELGDLTQLLTIDLTAKYHEPWSVGVGAFAALVAVAALGAFGGRAILRWVPVEWVRRAGGVALLGFAAYGIYSLVT